jgi:hypothetical protein
MRWLLRLVVPLVVIVFVVGRYGSDFHPPIGAATGVISRTQERAAIPQTEEDLSTFHGCGREGDARSLAVRALDRLKNRYTAPRQNEIDPKITLEEILAPGNDVSRWKVKQGAAIVGYVWDVKRGGIESVNCHARDDADRDTHLELVLDPMNGGASRRMIVEVITPRWRYIMHKRGLDWSTRSLRDRFLGRWVRVSGWMLFDQEHQGESENTAPGGPGSWRATAWEIHPVTSIEVVSRPR